ncbi:hypothetical protein [Desulfotalea psychrophila]|uniref:GRAM domain-containing protein n=1 Tax=Desulfotalea psychrophila (strain LSv54 / DSM 12343) TaxID=177439 RepID=Q6AKP8_DESPS|nr:hypothetical protein [Desulfotalea psychrophila]CAG37077.1 unknown protein [Desulfotalea psychrophila LSv54]
MDSGATGIGGAWLNSTATILWIAIGVLLVVGFVVLLLKMDKIRKGSRETLAKRYSSGDILCHDNFAEYFGMEVFKGKQTRGNGVLVLAQRELYFLRLQPKMELCIPLKKIKRCVTPSSFLGKSINKRLLKIEFQDEDGALNAVAWYVVDLERFVTALNLQRKKNRTKKKNVTHISHQ